MLYITFSIILGFIILSLALVDFLDIGLIVGYFLVKNKKKYIHVISILLILIILVLLIIYCYNHHKLNTQNTQRIELTTDKDTTTYFKAAAEGVYDIDFIYDKNIKDKNTHYYGDIKRLSWSIGENENFINEPMKQHDDLNGYYWMNKYRGINLKSVDLQNNEVLKVSVKVEASIETLLKNKVRILIHPNRKETDNLTQITHLIKYCALYLVFTVLSLQLFSRKYLGSKCAEN